jgi:hypothetical protein
MSKPAPMAPLPVYLLADHLDGVLAAGEDLVTCGADWRSLAERPGNPEDFARDQRVIAEDVRGYELILVAHVIKSREHARTLSQTDKRFAPVADLFVGATAILMDAVTECGDATGDDFETGDGLVAYVRSRGLIAPDAANVTHSAQLTIDDSFLVAKRLALGPLLDMAAAFLDALDTQYELFVEEDSDEDDDDQPLAGARKKEFGRRERMPVN